MAVSPATEERVVGLTTGANAEAPATRARATRSLYIVAAVGTGAR